MPYSKDGWMSRWDIQADDPVTEETTDYELKLLVIPGSETNGAPLCFIATVTIARYEPASPGEDWKPHNQLLVYRGEHLSLVEGVRAARAAAKRAELIRCGPSEAP